jgi:hypothetical protein
MRVVIYLLPFFLVFLATPIGMSFWWVHIITSIFVILNLGKLSKYFFFWLLLLIVIVFSSELRLSLEYFLTCSGLFAYSLSDEWKSAKPELRKWILILSFIGFYVVDYFNWGFVEKGSALMLLPIFLAIYFPLKKFNLRLTVNSIKQFFVYGASVLIILFSNKRTTLLGYLAALKNLFSNKALILISLLALGSSFLLKDNVERFYTKSIAPRTLIWQGAFKGFLDKPVLGHGFGTYTIDFPPYRVNNRDVIGAKETEYVVHGHSQILHQLFEMGVFGIFLFCTLLYFLYKYQRNAFLPFLVISLFNVSLQSFNQYLLLGLLFNPVSDFNKEYFSIQVQRQNLAKWLKLFLILMTVLIFSISCLGHYFYDQEAYSKAIKVDPLHPLYHFSRGALKINTDIEQSKIDLGNAVGLANGVGYIHGFYAATLLGTNDFDKAKVHIAKSLKQMGDDPYLLILSSFINKDDKEFSQEQYKKALELNEDLDFLLKDPTYSADEFIGVKSSNPRIMSFYRRGKKIYLPLPYIELE